MYSITKVFRFGMLMMVMVKGSHIISWMVLFREHLNPVAIYPKLNSIISRHKTGAFKYHCSIVVVATEPSFQTDSIIKLIAITTTTATRIGPHHDNGESHVVFLPAPPTSTLKPLRADFEVRGLEENGKGR